MFFNETFSFPERKMKIKCVLEWFMWIRYENVIILLCVYILWIWNSFYFKEICLLCFCYGTEVYKFLPVSGRWRFDNVLVLSSAFLQRTFRCIGMQRDTCRIFQVHQNMDNYHRHVFQKLRHLKLKRCS